MFVTLSFSRAGCAGLVGPSQPAFSYWPALPALLVALERRVGGGRVGQNLQPPVVVVVAPQIIVRTGGFDVTAFQQENAVHTSQGGESLGEEDNHPTSRNAGQRVVKKCQRVFVDWPNGFFDHENRRIAE